MAGELDAEVWSRLPTELMDLVLRRLPISSLCKFRAVCKHWSTLPTVSAEDPYFLCFPYRSLELDHSLPCKLYSFARNRWEDLDLSFLAPLLYSFARNQWEDLGLSFLAQQCPGERSLGYIKLDNFCSDGGLLCLNGAICNDIENVKACFLLVCNPLTRAIKFLPSLDPDIPADYLERPMRSFDRSEDYLMHRDPESGAYKIFAVVVEFHVQLHYYMYDSNLRLWERILTLKRDGVEMDNVRSCSIVFNGVYYNCVRGGGEHVYKLSAYNMKEERLLVAGVKTELDSSIKSVSFLVRNDCLLLLAKTRRNRTRVYRIHDDSEEMRLSRCDGSKEIKLSEELDWYTAFAYRDFILFLKKVQTDFTVVNIADRKKAVKTRIVPLFPTGLRAIYPIYTRATFNLQATL